MFFKNIGKYNKNKLRGLNILFGLLHFVALVLVPTIIICTKYKIFQHNELTIKLTGVGLVLFVVLGLFAFIKLKNIVADLPEITYKQQAFKFTLQTIFSLIPYLLITMLLFYAKNDVIIAYNTFTYCLISLGIAELIDGLFLKYIKAEYKLRAKAMEVVEIENRKGLI